MRRSLRSVHEQRVQREIEPRHPAWAGSLNGPDRPFRFVIPRRLRRWARQSSLTDLDCSRGRLWRAIGRRRPRNVWMNTAEASDLADVVGELYVRYFGWRGVYRNLHRQFRANVDRVYGTPRRRNHLGAYVLGAAIGWGLGG